MSTITELPDRITQREQQLRQAEELLGSLPQQAGVAKGLFEGRFRKGYGGGEPADYDITPDGSRFVMVRQKNPVTPTVIHVVLNWPETLPMRSVDQTR